MAVPTKSGGELWAPLGRALAAPLGRALGPPETKVRIVPVS